MERRYLKERENKLLNLVRDHPLISGAVAGVIAGAIAIGGMTAYSGIKVKERVDKAYIKIQKEIEYEDNLKKFVQDSGCYIPGYANFKSK